MTGAAAPTPDFPAAARRHFSDAEYLVNGGRLPNADHHAGIAAECCLKAILLKFLGARLDPQNKPISQIGGQTIKHGYHLPPLWANINLVVNGRAGAQFAALIGGPNPFSAWDVSERYGDGSGITESRARGHIAEAKRVLAIYQQAEIAGALT